MQNYQTVPHPCVLMLFYCIMYSNSRCIAEQKYAPKHILSSSKIFWADPNHLISIHNVHNAVYM